MWGGEADRALVTAQVQRWGLNTQGMAPWTKGQQVPFNTVKRDNSPPPAVRSSGERPLTDTKPAGGPRENWILRPVLRHTLQEARASCSLKCLACIPPEPQPRSANHQQMAFGGIPGHTCASWPCSALGSLVQCPGAPPLTRGLNSTSRGGSGAES